MRICGLIIDGFDNARCDLIPFQSVRAGFRLALQNGRKRGSPKNSSLYQGLQMGNAHDISQVETAPRRQINTGKAY